ncbi:MAG: hypothetical protein WAN11_01680 [Syntrophobacteraceae bacterium]
MKRDKNIRSYTAAELKAKRAGSRTDLTKVDAMTDEELERRIAGDEGERDLKPDWTRARLVLPAPSPLLPASCSPLLASSILTKGIFLGCKRF